MHKANQSKYIDLNRGKKSVRDKGTACVLTACCLYRKYPLN